MPNIPSVNTMVKRGFTLEQSKSVRAEMERFQDQYWRGGVRPTKTLERINAIIGGYGVEYIPRGHNARSPAIEYVNAGDPYADTVMFVSGRFIVGCWGDIVERGNYD